MRAGSAAAAGEEERSKTQSQKFPGALFERPVGAGFPSEDLPNE